MKLGVAAWNFHGGNVFSKIFKETGINRGSMYLGLNVDVVFFKSSVKVVFFELCVELHCGIHSVDQQ